MADNTPGFVHLHNHSTYSLLDGAQKIHEMCARAAEDGQEAVAITDHGNLFGAMEFGRQAARQRPEGDRRPRGVHRAGRAARTASRRTSRAWGARTTTT